MLMGWKGNHIQDGEEKAKVYVVNVFNGDVIQSYAGGYNTVYGMDSFSDQVIYVAGRRVVGVSPEYLSTLYYLGSGNELVAVQANDEFIFLVDKTAKLIRANVPIKQSDEPMFVQLDKNSLSRFTIVDSIVYCGDPQGGLMALKTTSMEQKWTFKDKRHTKKNSILTTPEVYGNYIFFKMENGVLYCLIHESGAFNWKVNQWGMRSTLSSPIVHGNTVFHGVGNGVSGINIHSGQKVWTYKTRCRVNAEIAIEDGVMYFGADDGRFRAIDVESQELKWVFSTDYMILSRAVICKDIVMFGSSGGWFYGINKNTGKLIWELKTDGPIDGSMTPIVKDELLYFGHHDGFIVDFENRKNVDMRDFYKVGR